MIRTPVAGLEFDLGVNPRVVDSSLRISLGETKWFCGFVLTITFATLDADMLWFKVVLIIEAEPTFLIPDRYALVHTVVPGLETLDSTLGRAAKSSGKLLFYLLPLHFLVVPSIDNIVALLCRILLINVTALASLRRWTWITAHAR